MKKILINTLYKPITTFFQNLFRTRYQTDMYIAQTQIVSNTHKKSFEKYKNFYTHKDIVIVATGPSLNMYRPIPDTINIAINSAIEFEKINFNYFFSIDYGSIKKCIKELENQSNLIKFYGVLPKHPSGLIELTNATSIIPESLILKHNANKFFVYSKRPNNNLNFNVDIDSTWLMDGGSSTFSAVQFALFTNPRKIYLVGCDCSSGYFNGKGKNDATSLIKIWKEFKKYADTYYPDTEIISINPVGLKGVFTDLYQD